MTNGRPAPDEGAMVTVRVKFRNVVRETRDGVTRYFYREGHGPRVRLQRAPTDPDFKKEYDAVALAYRAPKATREAGAGIAAPNTLRWWCERYYTTTHFKGLDEETRRVRRRIFESIWEEPVTPGSARKMGDCPMNRIGREHVQMLVDRKADAPEAGRGRVKVLRPVFRFAVLNGGMAASPIHDIEFGKRSGDGHHTWTPEEIAAFEATHGPGTKARLAMRIIRCAGFRISDVAEFGRQNCKDGWIIKTVKKNRVRKPKVVQIPILAELQEELDRAAPAGNAMAWVQTDYGRPFSIKGLGQKFKEWCVEAGLPHCSAHGVRKAASTIAAENGATESQLMAIFGWDDPKMAAHYTKKARARKLAESAPALLASEPKREQNPAENPANKTACGN